MYYKLITLLHTHKKYIILTKILSTISFDKLQNYKHLFIYSFALYFLERISHSMLLDNY